MTEEEKKKFLKQMGYSGSCMHREEAKMENKHQNQEAKGKAPSKRLGIAFAKTSIQKPKQTNKL